MHIAVDSYQYLHCRWDRSNPDGTDTVLVEYSRHGYNLDGKQLNV